MTTYPEGIPTLTAVGPKAATRDQRWKPTEWSAPIPNPRMTTAQIPVPATRLETKPSPPPALFEDRVLAGLRTRWADVHQGFDDDPRYGVQRADGLVVDVIVQLVAGFADARSRLETTWARGDEASAADIRFAATLYREFFDRLLAR
jgi:hypothetical protein